MINKGNSQTPSKHKRPINVWILTIYAFLSVGILTFLIAVNSYLTRNIDTSLISIVFSILLGLTIVFASIRTWQGKENARKLLLIALSLHYVVTVITDYLMIQSGSYSAQEVTGLWRQIILSVVLLGLYWVYFNSSEAKAFFRQEGKG